MPDEPKIQISEVNPGEEPLTLSAKLMTEIEHLYLPTMKGTIEEIRTQLDAAREVPIEAKEFLRKMLTITDPKHKYWRLDLTIHAQNGGTNGGWTISKL